MKKNRKIVLDPAGFGSPRLEKAMQGPGRRAWKVLRRQSKATSKMIARQVANLRRQSRLFWGADYRPNKVWERPRPKSSQRYSQAVARSVRWGRRGEWSPTPPGLGGRYRRWKRSRAPQYPTKPEEPAKPVPAIVELIRNPEL